MRTISWQFALRLRLVLAIVASVVQLAGCSANTAQNPGGGYSPVNADQLDDGPQSSRVMLNSHDVVSYFTQGRHARGLLLHTSVFQTVTFRFASAEHKALFDAAPDKYLPQFGGFCANGIAYAIPWGGSADSWLIVAGRLLIFASDDAKDAFLLTAEHNLSLANGYWKTEVQGANSMWQRSKRLVFKVPHYKSGEQLAADVAAAKAK